MHPGAGRQLNNWTRPRGTTTNTPGDTPMGQRVTLYLPDHLHARLDELPDDVSLSGIFQAGLEHELEKLADESGHAELKQPARS